MMIMSLNERDGGDTSVANNQMGEMEGPPIKSRREGEKIRACLKPSLIGGLILIAWCPWTNMDNTHTNVDWKRSINCITLRTHSALIHFTVVCE